MDARTEWLPPLSLARSLYFSVPLLHTTPLVASVRACVRVRLGACVARAHVRARARAPASYRTSRARIASAIRGTERGSLHVIRRP